MEHDTFGSISCLKLSTEFKYRSFGVERLDVVSASVANQTWSRVQALSKFGTFSSDMVAPERNAFCI